MICGGTISGNCATGNPAIATSPPMTVTIAITIATTGRLMKSLEIISVAVIQTNSAFFRVRLWIDLHARPEPLRAFDDYSLSKLQSVFDNPHRVGVIAKFDRADFDFVVTPNHRYLIPTLQLRDRALGHQQGAIFCRGHRAHATVLSGRKIFPGLGNNPAIRIAPVF